MCLPPTHTHIALCMCVREREREREREQEKETEKERERGKRECVVSLRLIKLEIPKSSKAVIPDSCGTQTCTLAPVYQSASTPAPR